MFTLARHNKLTTNNTRRKYLYSIVTDEKILTSIFNDHYIYINTVEKTTGVKPFSLNNNFKNKDEMILNIVKNYEKHPSILEINKTNSIIYI